MSRDAGTNSRRLSRNVEVLKTPSPNSFERVFKVAAWGSAAGTVVTLIAVGSPSMGRTSPRGRQRAGSLGFLDAELGRAARQAIAEAVLVATLEDGRIT